MQYPRLLVYGLVTLERACPATGLPCPVPTGLPCLGESHAKMCRDVADGVPGRGDQLISIATGQRISEPSFPPGGIAIRTRADTFTGYGQMSSRLAKELDHLGYPVVIDATDRDGSFLDIDPWIDRRIMTGLPDGPKLVITPPDQGFDLSGSIIFTMWETSRIPKSWVDNLNRSRCVVVPCRDNRDWFQDSGVTVPIRVVNLGVDISVFHPEDRPRSTMTVFGAAGRLSHGGERKGIAEVIAAFLDAFPDDPGVRLRLKLWPDCPIAIPDDPRIEVNRNSLSVDDLATWYRGLDAFVTMSKGEGFGLQPLQAMACGVPIIGALYSGHAEYIEAGSSYPVGYDLVPVPLSHNVYAGLGTWCLPRPDDVIESMRHVRAWPDAARQRGRRAASRACQFSWSRSGRKLASVLREFGLIGEREDRAALAVRAERCEFGSGACGCGPGQDRDCSHPDRPAKVTKTYCIDECLAKG